MNTQSDNTFLAEQSIPPHIDTYTKVSDYVLVSNYHNEKEREENIRLARFLGEKTREVVYVLPHIQPTLVFHK